MSRHESRVSVVHEENADRVLWFNLDDFGPIPRPFKLRNVQQLQTSQIATSNFDKDNTVENRNNGHIEHTVEHR